MSEAKPLSAERRAEILEAMDMDEYGDAVGLPMIRDILAAEEYWRMAVKNASLYTEQVCSFCHEAPETHKPECPWALAHRD